MRNNRHWYNVWSPESFPLQYVLRLKYDVYNQRIRYDQYHRNDIVYKKIYLIFILQYKQVHRIAKKKCYLNRMIAQ